MTDSTKINKSFQPGSRRISEVYAPLSQRVRTSGPLLTQQRYTGAATADVDFGYDERLRMSSLTVAGERIAYGYDRDGLMTSAGAETLTRGVHSPERPCPS